ncbi:MAG TPA: hydrolase [Burkholderiales bacterium]|nr:hydrolase [Burkholderiales bacterium]
MTVPYRAPAWLPGGHLQTIYPFLFRRLPLPPLARERWATPDGDFIEVDWLAGDRKAPVLVLFHGLEGSSGSHYARALLNYARAQGWRAAVPHFRGCGGSPNRLPRAYHSGDYQEIEWILARVAQHHSEAARYALGVSLGGNALLKWLAIKRQSAQRYIARAAVVSPPMDLSVAGTRLGRGFNRVYTWSFLRTLKHKSIEKLARFPALYDRGAVLAARTLRQFDDVVTAPLHGFRDAEDYWRRASTRTQLREITIPTLIIHARNDPFLPSAHLPSVNEVSPSVELEFPDQGGHAGFVSGRFPGHLEWLPRRTFAFFQST